jgi:hypothetical protein
MDNQYKDKSSYEETLKLSKENPNINLFIWPEHLRNFKDVNDTIIYSDKFLNLWSNEKFLINRIFHRSKSKNRIKKMKNRLKSVLHFCLQKTLKVINLLYVRQYILLHLE